MIGSVAAWLMTHRPFKWLTDWWWKDRGLPR